MTHRDRFETQPRPGLAAGAFSLLALPQKDVWRIASDCSGDFLPPPSPPAEKLVDKNIAAVADGKFASGTWPRET
jgi:hypothetical protein